MKIAVLFGGISTERNVSITGGKAVIEALRSKGHDVVAIDPAFGADPERRAEQQLTNIESFPTAEELAQFSPRSLMECVNSNLFDGVQAAFVMLHGKYGEDGIIQALLELRGIPYTGSDVKSNAISIDKSASKILMNSVGVLTAPWLMVTAAQADDYEYLKEIRAELGHDLVVKPNDQGSSIGVTIVKKGNLDELAKGIRLAGQYSNRIMVEKFIAGREITVGVIGDGVLPIVEIVADGGSYDYKHKYSKGHTNYICPAELPHDVADFTLNMAWAAHSALGCYGISRVDFRLDEDYQAYCLEVNTVPGFTSTSLVPMAAKQLGFEFPELCEKIVELALLKRK